MLEKSQVGVELSMLHSLKPPVHVVTLLEEHVTTLLQECICCMLEKMFDQNRNIQLTKNVEQTS